MGKLLPLKCSKTFLKKMVFSFHLKWIHLLNKHWCSLCRAPHSSPEGHQGLTEAHAQAGQDITSFSHLNEINLLTLPFKAAQMYGTWAMCQTWKERSLGNKAVFLFLKEMLDFLTLSSCTDCLMLPNPPWGRRGGRMWAAPARQALCPCQDAVRQAGAMEHKQTWPLR